MFQSMLSSLLSRKAKAGTEGRDPETGTETKAMDESCSLAYPLLFDQPAFLYRPRALALGCSTTQSGLGPLPSSINLKKKKECPHQANLRKEFSHSLLHRTLACVRMSKTKQNLTPPSSVLGCCRSCVGGLQQVIALPPSPTAFPSSPTALPHPPQHSPILQPFHASCPFFEIFPEPWKEGWMMPQMMPHAT